MFRKMLETWENVLRFAQENLNSDLLFHVVPLHDKIHSADNSPSILFIYNLNKRKTYYYGFNHPDVKIPKPLNHKEFVEVLSNLRGRKWAVDKKGMMHMVPIRGLYDVGLVPHLQENQIFDVESFDTNAHQLIRRQMPKRVGFGRFVPLSKHLESFSEIVDSCEKFLKNAVVDDAFKSFNFQIIEPLSEVESRGLAIDPVKFSEHFGVYNNAFGGCPKGGRVYTQYNFYTSTGRPSNRFGGINYAALNKEDGSRRVFISRHGKAGKLVLIDYSTFHPRIIGLLTDYHIPTDVDIYEYLARLYFNKSEVDEGDIGDAKQITFRQLFGGVEQKYSHIKYLSHLKDFIDYQWGFFNQNGYVETPIFKRRITSKHIQHPKPATVFNYILQAVEGEISIPVLGEVNKLLSGRKTQAVLYIYDSILFDYHVEDGDVLKEIYFLMSLDGKFPMKIYIGDNYHDLELVT
jgi:hypothetical protein